MTVTESSGTAPTFAGPSLSPSRAADFKTCPLLFRFRTIDRLPEQATPDQVRGTLVHAVLERLFDLPRTERTRGAAEALVEPQWLRLIEQEPALAALFDPAPPAQPEPPAQPTPPAPAAVPAPPTALPPPAALTPSAEPAPSAAAPAPHTAPAPSIALAPSDRPGLPAQPAPSAAPASPAGQPTSTGPGPSAGPAPSDAPVELMLDGMPLAPDARLESFFASARGLLGSYFAVEDPTRLEPAEREALVSTLVDEELLIRGYIDRLDVSPTGDLRVVDYKTGGAPREAFEGRALFQLKFYALVLWRTRGVVPKVLRLLYLKDEEILDYSPDAEELERFERTLVALSHAIERAKEDRDFRAKPSRLCGWCSHQALCPEFGGTPPPYPERAPQPDAPPEDLLATAD